MNDAVLKPFVALIPACLLFAWRGNHLATKKEYVLNLPVAWRSGACRRCSCSRVRSASCLSSNRLGIPK